MRVHRQVKPESWGKPANLFLIPLLVVPLVLFLLISPIGAQGASIDLKPSSGVAGTPVKVSGTGFPMNKVVSIIFYTEQVGSNVTDDNGQFTETIIIPSKYAPGSYYITASAPGVSVSKTFELLAPGGTATRTPVSTNTSTPAATTAAKPAPTPSSNTTVPLTPTATSTPAEEIPFPFIKAGFWGWVFLGILLFLVLAAAVLATQWYISKYSSTDYRDYSRLEKELAQTRQKLEIADQELMRSRKERAALQAQLPVAKTNYYKLSKEVRDSLPQLSETLLKQLDDEPPKEDYGAYFERTRALQAIGSYYATRAKTGKTLREECWVIAREIETEEPELSRVLQQVIPSADVAALESLKPVLEQMKKQVEKKPLPDEIQNQLSSLEKSVEGVRDYSYRLIPSRLLEFARNLIKLPAPEKENELRKKTVEEIVKLINEYLRL